MPELASPPPERRGWHRAWGAEASTGQSGDGAGPGQRGTARRGGAGARGPPRHGPALRAAARCLGHRGRGGEAGDGTVAERCGGLQGERASVGARAGGRRAWRRAGGAAAQASVEAGRQRGVAVAWR